MHCMPGFLRKYVDHNRIGCPPLAADDPLLLHMMQGMALSAKNVGVHYNVIGVLDFNICWDEALVVEDHVNIFSL